MSNFVLRQLVIWVRPVMILDKFGCNACSATPLFHVVSTAVQVSCYTYWFFLLAQKNDAFIELWCHEVTCIRLLVLLIHLFGFKLKMNTFLWTCADTPYFHTYEWPIFCIMEILSHAIPLVWKLYCVLPIEKKEESFLYEGLSGYAQDLDRQLPMDSCHICRSYLKKIFTSLAAVACCCYNLLSEVSDLGHAYKCSTTVPVMPCRPKSRTFEIHVCKRCRNTFTCT
jgi:hypothetical protein